MTDNQPRYTTKRLHEEIAKARAYGMEFAASMCVERAAEYDASFDSTAYKTETLAGSAALTAIAAKIREKAASPSPETNTSAPDALLKEAIDAVWRCSLIIESSVRRGDGPMQYAEVQYALELVKEVRAALNAEGQP
ncbi:hypothetical protein J2T09_002317 [Neorhizobium huautlense]|uniref:Phage protein n=1 Tax=Neorhizobium huautlense TaxID=67774 RepID=A0ABT9PSZ2_9HYPH|nr:hypothetical protein [Neorhizobium huautlense]MDP9837565.1 hypothetical protein [Neorhizobium huautlense]